MRAKGRTRIEGYLFLLVIGMVTSIASTISQDAFASKALAYVRRAI
jgi:hypothetical protein